VWAQPLNKPGNSKPAFSHRLLVICFIRQFMGSFPAAL
jgi:hypothetical protein